MEENNNKNNTSADITPKSVDTVTPLATPDDQPSIASQVASDTPDAKASSPEPISPEPAAPPTPEPAPEPQSPSDSTDQPSAFSIAPKKSGGSKLGLIIALAIVLLCGAAVALYFAFSGPADKNAFVTEAVEKAIYAEVANFSGSFDTSDSGTDISVSFIGAIDVQNHAKLQLDISINQHSTNIDLQGQAIVSDGDIYVKIDGIKEAIYSTFGAFTLDHLSEENSSVNPIISLATKIDGEWIKISAEDLKTYTGVDVASCAMVSPAIRGDIATVYKENSFIVVGDELGERDGSLGYQISFDQNKSQAFGHALSKLSSVNDFITCLGDNLSVSSIFDSSSSDASTPPASAEIWINKNSREIANFQPKLTVDSGSGAIKFSTKNKGAIDVQVPSNYTALSEISSGLQDIFMQFTPSYDYDLDISQDFDFDDSDLNIDVIDN